MQGHPCRASPSRTPGSVDSRAAPSCVIGVYGYLLCKVPYTSTIPSARTSMPRSLGLTSLRILAAIRDGDSYGLDIIVATGLASGTVYPTLGRLRRSGLVVPRWEDSQVAEREGRPRRRYYTLSPAGEEALREGVERVRAVGDSLRLNEAPEAS